MACDLSPSVYFGIPCLSEQSFQKIVLFIEEIPWEAGALLVASFAAHTLYLPIWSPLAGIGIAVGCGKLALKALEWYDTKIFIDLTKKACNISQQYPRLQLTLLICSFAISIVSKTAGFATGALLGTFGAVVLDVEKVKLKQRANRV